MKKEKEKKEKKRKREYNNKQTKIRNG